MYTNAQRKGSATQSSVSSAMSGITTRRPGRHTAENTWSRITFRWSCPGKGLRRLSCQATARFACGIRALIAQNGCNPSVLYLIGRHISQITAYHGSHDVRTPDARRYSMTRTLSRTICMIYITYRKRSSCQSRPRSKGGLMVSYWRGLPPRSQGWKTIKSICASSSTTATQSPKLVHADLKCQGVTGQALEADYGHSILGVGDPGQGGPVRPLLLPFICQLQYPIYFWPRHILTNCFPSSPIPWIPVPFLQPRITLRFPS